MSNKITANKKFLEEQVRIALLGEAWGDSLPDWAPDWTKTVVNSVEESGKSLVRWTNKKIYNNDREQAVSRIESEDPEVGYIKDFFSLYSSTCYEGSSYSRAFPKTWAIEDPGTYCIQPDVVKSLKSWRDKNRTKFIKQASSISDKDRLFKISKDYVEDFLDEFANYGFSWEAGAQKLVVEETVANYIVKMALEDQRFISNWDSQLKGSAPCVLDLFPALFKFIYYLNFDSRGKRPSSSKLYSIARSVSSGNDYLSFLKREKSSRFVGLLRRNSKLREKWAGFCCNMTFDPYGEKSLEHWTKEAKALTTEETRDTKEQYIDMGVGLAGWVIADVVAFKATTAAVAAIAGAPATGGASLALGAIYIGVTCLLCFDPFEWFSIRDDVEDELASILKILEELLEISSSTNQSISPEDKEKEKEDDNPKLLDLESKFLDSVQEIYDLLHNEMTKGMQREISSKKTAMEHKKILLRNMTRSLQLINQNVKKVNFKEKELNQEEIKGSIAMFGKLLQQIKNESDEPQTMWDDKIKSDIGLGKDLSTAEFIRESNLLEEQQETGLDDSTGLLNKWLLKFEKEYRWLDLSDEGAKSTLENARKLADKELGDFLTSSGASKKFVYKIKEMQPEAYKKIISNSSAYVTNQADASLDWFESFFGRAEVFDSKETASSTIMHAKWRNNPNGIKSEDSYSYNEFLSEKLVSADDLEAYCFIGLGHSLANTSFYYSSNQTSIFHGGSISSLVKDRSKVQKAGSQITVPNKGVQIDRLRSMIRNDFTEVLKEKSELTELSNELSQMYKAQSSADVGNIKITKIRILQILTQVYYYTKSHNANFILKILKKDDAESEKMEKLGIQLSRLNKSQQNTDVHSNLISALRKSGSFKIMLFEALMSIK